VARLAHRAPSQRVLRRLDADLARLSHLFGTGAATRAAERILVWAHVLAILSFLAYLPHSKHLHIATAAVNVWFGRTRARGRLEPLHSTRRASRTSSCGSAPAPSPT